MSSAQLKVAFLGLGSMGNGIAQNILKKGFSLVVWSRTASKADSLVKAGATVASTAREAVANADVIVSCLYDDKSCLDTAQGENGYLVSIRKDAVHVNVTTITPEAADRLEKLHEQNGAHYLTGTVLGRPDVAAAGKLRCFLGGNAQAIERARPVIESYTLAPLILVGDKPSKANVVKLSANMILAANMSLFGQIYALNERWNIDHDVTRQVIGIFNSHPGLSAYETRIRDRDYQRASGEGFSVEGGLKDINAMIHAGEQVGVPLPFCSTMREQYTSALGNGLKDLDWSALADVPRLHAGLPLPSQKKE